MSIDILFVPRKLEEWEWEEVKHRCLLGTNVYIIKYRCSKIPIKRVLMVHMDKFTSF
jgi:hypothetical protein